MSQVGGTVKCLADDYVKQNKVVIQDVADFLHGAETNNQRAKLIIHLSRQMNTS